MNDLKTDRSPIRNRLNTAIYFILPYAAGLSVAIFLLIAGSERPDKALFAFFVSPLTNLFYLGNMVDQAGLILICALGFLLTWRIGVYNLGGEGQAYLGAIVAAQVALSVSGTNSFFGVLVTILSSLGLAGTLGWLIGFLKEKLGISELISSFLMSGALLPLIDYAISGPLRDQTGNLLATPPIDEALWLQSLLSLSSLNAGILFAPLLAVGVAFVLSRTRIGYELRIVEQNRELANSHGIRSSFLVIACFVAGAAIHGVAGALTVIGSKHAAFVGITSGLGWNGIAAALLGRGNPIGAVIGAIVFAYLGAGARAAMVHTDFTFELGAVIQGMVFLLVTLKSVRRAGKK